MYILASQLDVLVSVKNFYFIASFLLFFYSPGANIFLTSSGLIKLGDFGCSVKLKNNAQTMPGEVNSTLGTAGERLKVVVSMFKHQRAW